MSKSGTENFAEMMKRIGICLASSLALVLSGCVEEQLEQKVVTPPTVNEGEVAFGAVVNEDTSDTPQTRTIYGEPGDYQNYSSLEINWLAGQDQVRVYSPQASEECKSADYTVMSTGENTGYYLQKNGEVGVRWGDVSQPHEFYAFYPLTVQDGTGGDKTIEGLENGTVVSATIPVAQEKGSIQPMENGGVTWKIVAPNMTYAMMVGKETWSPTTTGGETASRNVSLEFKPIVLVLDVVVNAGSSTYYVTGVSVRSKTQPIVGSFNYDVKEEIFTYTSPSNESNRLAWVDCTENGQPTPLEPGQKLNVKFFLLPRDIESEELTVSVMLANGQTLTQALVPNNGDGQKLIHGQIIKVRTPAIKPAQPSNWMSMIDNDVLFASQLSLPGSKYSYTYTQYDRETNNYNPNSQIMTTYQTLDIGEQFDAGVRAFDIKVNTGGSRNYSHEARIYVNGQDLTDNDGGYQTLGDMLTLLKSKLDLVPTEFVIVSINWVDNGRTADQWVSDIDNAVEEWHNDGNARVDNEEDGSTENDDDGDYFRDITSSTTVGIMRHGIGIMIHAPESYTGITTKYLNVIDGYSSSVRNTSLVNYEIENNRANGRIYIQNLQQVNNSTLNLYPYYMTEDNVLKGTELVDLMETKKNLIDQLFTMSRNNNNNDDVNTRTNNLYVNDLGGFCVVNDGRSTGWADAIYGICESGPLGVIWNWEESDIYLTDYRTKDNYTYFQDDTNGYSWDRPRASERHSGETSLEITSRINTDKGEGGNNALFAEEINDYAVTQISSLVNEGRTPLGVVYMNFAGTDLVTFDRAYNVHGIALPALIMSNNFKFALATSSNRSNASGYDSEGSAIQ